MLALLFATAAFAVSNYPALIEEDLGMPCALTCDLCHITKRGGGQPDTPFGLALVQRGLTLDQRSLAPALAQMASDGVDSDADGIPDLDALAAGEDPDPDGDAVCAESEDLPDSCATAQPTRWGWLVALGFALGRRRRLSASP